MLENKQHYCIPATHACLAGHFPDKPIVPGVVILNYVQQQLLSWLPQYTINTLAQAKFRYPLYPDQTFTINLMQSSTHKIKFTCTHNTHILVTGLFIINEKKGPEHD